MPMLTFRHQQTTREPAVSEGAPASQLARQQATLVAL